MASRIREYRAARLAMDRATAELLNRAAHYQGPQHSIGDTYYLLSAAREYGRAMPRLEKMRGR